MNYFNNQKSINISIIVILLIQILMLAVGIFGFIIVDNNNSEKISDIQFHQTIQENNIDDLNTLIIKQNNINHQNNFKNDEN